MAKGTFQSFGFSPQLLKSISSIGYSLPTPIQRKCFPPILAGKDVIVNSRTGSGKTAGFVLPMIERLGCSHSKIVGIRGLVLSPTRELALQTYRVIRKLASKTDMVICALTGGSSLDKQFESLSENPDIVVATPGRLYHHIVEAELSLMAIKVLVFDEADRLFEVCLIDQIESILEISPKNRQLVLVSATIPTTLSSFSKARLNDPEIIQVDSDYLISETLKLTFLFIREDEKLAALLFLIRNEIPFNERAIIFCSTKHHVDYIAKMFLANNITTSYIYGNMDQGARIEQLNKFRKNKTRSLIVTDIAARGIDIPMVQFVINFDYPLSPKLFVHRTGRTARAGRPGRAFSLITSRDLSYTFDLCLFLGLKMTTMHNLEKELIKDISDDSTVESLDFKQDSTIPNNLESLNNKCDLNNNTFILASLPDLSSEIESIERILSEDAEIERSRRSMISAYSLYLKTRTPSSKESLRRSKALLEESGGISKILMTIHPDLNYFKEKFESSKMFLVKNDPLLEHLRTFRPASKRTNVQIKDNHSRNCCKIGKTVLKSSLKMERIKEMSNIAKSFLNNSSEKSLEKDFSLQDTFENAEVVEDIEFCSNKKTINKKRKPKRQASKSNSVEQFFIPYKNTERELTRITGLQIEKTSFDINPDEEGELRKTRFVRKWNSAKKKYEIIDKSKFNSIKKVNESGVKVKGELRSTGKYKKWKANTNLKIQNIGEIEEVRTHKHKDMRANKKIEELNEELNDSETLYNIREKHKGILESIRKGIKLTHKQNRIAKKIGLIKTNKSNVKTSNISQLKTPQQILKERTQCIKKRMKNDIEFRRKQISKTTQEFKEKNLRKVIQKGRPNRSKMIILKKFS